MRWLSRLVTLLVIVALIGGIALLIRARMPKSNVGGTFHTCALFRDGTRLATGSPVMISGVRVGEVTHLSIDGNFAKIDMVLRNDTAIPNDAWVTKRAYSPFGDSYVEIIPTTGEVGASSAQRIRNGECFTRVLEGSSTDTVLRSVSRAMDPFDRGLERMHEVSLYGRKWTNGVLEDGIGGANHWLDEGHIDRPIERANQAMGRIANATTGAADAVHDAKPKVDNTFDRVEKGAATARKKIAELKVALQNGMRNAREGMNKMDQPVDDVAEYLAAVNDGRGNDAKGKLGRLVNQPQLADSIEDATDGAREGISSFTRFKSWLGLRTEWNVFAMQPRFFLTAEVRARSDKFYLIELERGPLGAAPGDQLRDAPGTADWTRHQQIKDGIRFTAQFGKTFGNWFQVRGGLKESTFGFGADILVHEGKLKFSGDVYGSFSYTPRVKLAAALAVFRSIYLIAGVDDALNPLGIRPPGYGYLPIVKGNTDVPIQFDKVRYGRDYFLGATLQFDDADLSVLLRVYGALLIGLL